MVSIILPTYNEAENIRQIIPMIHEALSASGIEYEVIVVDDDSPDGTAQEASRMADRFPVVAKTNPRILEIPIVFADRQKGVSKLDTKAQLEYLQHLWKLYRYRYRAWAQFLAFCLVGGSGVLVDTVVLVSLVEFCSLTPILAAVFGFLVAVSWNYHWNSNMMHLLMEYAGMGERPWYVLASLAGILAATVFNFLGAKWLVFRESVLG